VAIAGGATGWAVGAAGAILKLQGGVWTQVSSPTGYDLHSVAAVDEQNAWAVGDGGVILLYGAVPVPVTVTPTATQTPAPTATATRTSTPSRTPAMTGLYVPLVLR